MDRVESGIYQVQSQRHGTVIHNGRPVGEGTLLFSPECSAIRGRTALADGCRTANINALRIRKKHKGKGYISALVRMMEQ